MFTTPATPAPTYSTLGTGTRVKVLATTPNPTGTADTRTVCTLPAAQATAVTQALTGLAELRDIVLFDAARDHAGTVCYLRRAVMAAVETGDTAGVPAAVDPLAVAAALVPDAPRRALVEEAGLLFAGTEDVLVPVELTDEFGGVLFFRGANSWLTDAADDDLVDLLTGDDDSGPLYEGLLAQLRSEDEAVDEVCDGGWVDVNVPDESVRAWVDRHRPHLADRLEGEVVDLGLGD